MRSRKKSLETSRTSLLSELLQQRYQFGLRVVRGERRPVAAMFLKE
jgi:hypothetical protein